MRVRRFAAAQRQLADLEGIRRGQAKRRAFLQVADELLEQGQRLLLFQPPRGAVTGKQLASPPAISSTPFSPAIRTLSSPWVGAEPGRK